MRSCVCVLGWHYQNQLYDSLHRIPDIDIFILSHRPFENIPFWVNKITTHERIIVKPNIGYDWGGFQQFISLFVFNDYPYIFFLHDDILILDSNVFEISIDLIESNDRSCLIGNGHQSLKRNWPQTHIHSYAHSHWKPPSWEFCHDTVRGSFWGTNRQSLMRIQPLEVFWDRRKWQGIGAGNWSLRATCGKFQDKLGESAFKFLSETYLKSDYIQELERGQFDYSASNPPLGWRVKNRLLVGFSSSLMTLYMDSKSIKNRQHLSMFMDAVFKYI